MARIIKNTHIEAQYDWPEHAFIQGGEYGVVFGRPDGAYETAFFEAFPGDTFLRGEGRTLAEAEDSCWKQYQTWAKCSDGTGQHGPFERRQYTNGAGFCTKCGTWKSKAFEPLPEADGPMGNSLLERVFTGRDPDAVAEVLNAVIHADELPHGGSGRTPGTES